MGPRRRVYKNQASKPTTDSKSELYKKTPKKIPTISQDLNYYVEQ